MILISLKNLDDNYRYFSREFVNHIKCDPNCHFRRPVYDDVIYRDNLNLLSNVEIKIKAEDLRLTMVTL